MVNKDDVFIEPPEISVLSTWLMLLLVETLSSVVCV